MKRLAWYTIHPLDKTQNKIWKYTFWASRKIKLLFVICIIGLKILAGHIIHSSDTLQNESLYLISGITQVGLQLKLVVRIHQASVMPPTPHLLLQKEMYEGGCRSVTRTYTPLCTNKKSTFLKISFYLKQFTLIQGNMINAWMGLSSIPWVFSECRHLYAWANTSISDKGQGEKYRWDKVQWGTISEEREKVQMCQIQIQMNAQQ